MDTTLNIPAIHSWTHTGTDVLIVKFVGKDGRSYNGFQWPLTVGADVTAPDWRPDTECGGGLHGWPWLKSNTWYHLNERGDFVEAAE